MLRRRVGAHGRADAFLAKLPQHFRRAVVRFSVFPHQFRFFFDNQPREFAAHLRAAAAQQHVLNPLRRLAEQRENPRVRRGRPADREQRFPIGPHGVPLRFVQRAVHVEDRQFHDATFLIKSM